MKLRSDFCVRDTDEGITDLVPFPRPQGCTSFLRKQIENGSLKTREEAGREPGGGRGEALTQKPGEEAVSRKVWSSHQMPPGLRSCPWVYQIGGPRCPLFPSGITDALGWVDSRTWGGGDSEYSDQCSPLAIALPPFCTGLQAPGRLRTCFLHHCVLP